MTIDELPYDEDVDPDNLELEYRISARQQELETPIVRRTLRRLGELGARLGRRYAPTDYRHRVRDQLLRAGWRSQAAFDRFIALRLGALISAPFVLLAAALLIPLSLGLALAIGVVAAVFVGMAPDLLLQQAVERREARIRAELPELLDLLVLCVDAGLGFDTALARAVLTMDGDLTREFSVALGEMRAGADRSEALDRVAERAAVQEVRTFVSALMRADVYGIPLHDALRQKARELRTRRRQRAQRKARQSPVKMLLPMVLFIFPPLLIVTLGPAVIDIADAFDIP